MSVSLSSTGKVFEVVTKYLDLNPVHRLLYLKKKQKKHYADVISFGKMIDLSEINRTSSKVLL